MEFLKVTITNVDEPKSIHALFNPKEYSISKQTTWVNHEQYGKDMPDAQFTIGQRRELSMELFFDTYADRTNVKEYVQQIEDLMLIDHHKHRPPILLVSWGNSKLNFKCVLEQMEQRYTMFMKDGTPVRAIINVVFKEIDPAQKGAIVKKGELESPDHTKVKIFKEGESLQDLAYFEYDDPSLWKIIAEHNSVDDPTNIKSGTKIEIPPL